MRVLQGARRATVTLIVGIALLPDVAAPAPAGDSPRRTVGLALGGGAARGLAHVGVLKWLHEHRIPIDAVAGTSMGGLVGGFLATGMLPDEVMAVVSAMDWARLLAPEAPFADKTFRRKEDARAFPSVLEFGVKRGFSLPTGLSPAEQVNLILNRLALPYHATPRFADLPIPFKCVAVDLRAGEQVVLESGRLDEAMRATMAIPGVFTPVRAGDRVLVDGGVLNNVPADVARSMGVDVVLAVDVGRVLNREKKSDSLLAVMGDALDVMVQDAGRRVLPFADVVLVPELKGVAGFDFGRAEEIVRRGYEAADAHREELLPLAVSEREYRAHLDARGARRRTAVAQPDFLIIEGVSQAEGALMRRKLTRHLRRPFSPDALERDLSALTGSNRYDAVTYRLQDFGDRIGLVVTAHQREHAPPYVLAALDIQNTDSSSVSAALRGRLVFFDLLTPGSDTRLDVSLGDTLGVAAEWALALGSSGLFVAPGVSYTRVYENLFQHGNLVAEYRRLSRQAAFDVGYASPRRFELRLGYGYERLGGNVRIGSPALPEVSGTQRWWRGRVIFDGQTSPVMPDRGLYARVDARQFTETADLRTSIDTIERLDPNDLLSAEVTASYFHPIGRRGRVLLAGAGGSSFGKTAVLNDFALGGPMALGAFQRGELHGSHYALAHVGYFHEIGRILEGAFGRLYAGGWVENGAVFERVRDAQIKTNLSGGFIMETVLGPAFLTGSVGFDGHYRIYLGLGPFFRR